MPSKTRMVADPRRTREDSHSSRQTDAGHIAEGADLFLGRGAAFLPMRSAATDATYSRVMFYAKVALRRFTAASADLSVELRSVTLAHRRATFRTNLAVKLASILLTRRGSSALCGLSPRPWSRLATYALPVHRLPSSRLLLFCHLQDPFLVFRPPMPSGRQCARAADGVALWRYTPFATVAMWRQRIAMLPQGCLNTSSIIHV